MSNNKTPSIASVAYDPLPQYLKLENFADYPIKRLKSISELHMTLLSVEFFWLSILNVAKTHKMVDKMSICLTGSAYSSSTDYFDPQFICLSNSPTPLSCSVYTQSHSRLLINIHTKCTTEQELKKVAMSCRAKFKVKAINSLKTIGRYPANLGEYFGQGLLKINTPKVIDKNTTEHTLMSWVLPDDIYQFRQAIVEKELLNLQAPQAKDPSTQITTVKKNNKI